jgi:two-component system LytT family response regulator
MTFNCTIIDDSKSCTSLLAGYLSESKANPHLIKTYTDPLTALAEIKHGNPLDIVFMDILMTNINGMQLSRLLKDKIRYLVITACDPSYAIDAFDLNACSYLLKPISQKKLDETLNKILEIEKNKLVTIRDAKHFFIKSNISELSKIYVNDIIAVQGASNYVKIHTSDQKSYITYGKMRDYEHDLSTSGNFIRVNKSFIISIPAIKLIKRKKITLNNGFQISIGNTYKDSIKQHLTML